MPRIRLPQVPDVQSAVYAGARPADESAKFRGQMALAEGLSNVGTAMQRFAAQSARAKNEADIVDARLELDRAQSDIQAEFEANPNPDQWEAITERRLAQASGAIFSSQRSATMSPDVRRQLNQEVQVVSSKVSLSVRNQAMRQQNQESDAILSMAQARDVAKGNLEGAMEYVETRRRLGLISDATAVIEREGVAVGVDRQAVARAINDDPHGAIEALEETTEGGRFRNFKNLSETDRISAVRSAKNARETARAETAQALAEQIYAGPTSAIGIEQRIDEAVKDRSILPSQANNLKRLAQGTRTPLEMAAEGSQLWQGALDLDRSDPDYIQKAMRLRAQAHGLDPEVKAPIIEALNQKDRNEVSADIQKVYDMLNRDFRANAFGNVQTWTATEAKAENKRREKEARRMFRADEAWVPVVEGDWKSTEEGEEASAQLFRYQRAMREFLQKTPNASVDDIMAYRSSLTATDRQVAIGSEVFDALSGAVVQ